MNLRAFLERIGFVRDDLTEDEQDLIRAAAGYRGDRFVEHFFVLHPREGETVVYQPPDEEMS